MPISIATKQKIKQALDNAVSALNKKPTTDCDWIFNDCKEMIIEAVKQKASLSSIVKAISAGRYSLSYIDKKTDEKKEKELKVTTQKLDKWLKGQGIKRRVHRRAKRPKAKS